MRPPYVLTLAALLCGAAVAHAQTAAPIPAPATASPAAPQAVPAPEMPPMRTITVQAGTGTLLRLPGPAATVMSAQPGIARVQPASPTSLFLMGVAAGRTTVIATNDAGTPIVQYDITVIPPAGQPAPSAQGGGGEPAPPSTAITAELAAKIRNAIVQMVTGASDIRVTPAGHAVVLAGTVTTPAAAAQAEAVARGFLDGKAEVIAQMLVLGRLQVNVRVRVAEISRTITREMGLNWQALGNSGHWLFGLASGAASTAASGASNLFPLGQASAGITTLGNVPAGQAGFSYGQNLDGLIDALAADQLITILAEPNLTALSGETASFLAGGEFPVPVAGNGIGNTTTISVTFQQFGVSLAVVPTVLSGNRLNLRIRPEVSELSAAGAVTMPIGSGSLQIPALTVRRAETTVELGSGQSFAIAGLLQKTSTDITNAIPGLGETPVLGALFKSNSFQRGESELVIVVTPYIVKPTDSPRDIALPTDGFRPATDLDRVLFGRQMAPSAGTAPLNAGFIVK